MLACVWNHPCRDAPAGDRASLTSSSLKHWICRWSMASNVYLATMGVAILNLPYAMGSMTWVGGVVSGVVAYLVSFYTMYLMLELHEHKGRRFNRYRELGELAFGASVHLVAVCLLAQADGTPLISYRLGPFLLRHPGSHATAV